MEFSYDINGYLKQSKMFLSNPQKDRIGTIADACEIKLVQNFNNLTELEFTIYKKLNGEYNDLYDEIIKMRLIEVQYVGWFHILSAKEKYDESSAEGYKAVKCCFLENALIYRKISDINGVFALYDVGSPDKSLLHIIASETGWSIAHVSNSLLSKYRTFSEDTVQIYNFLTTTVSKSYECVFQFNVYDKSISAYKLDEIGSLTDIVLSKKNILKEWEKDDGTEVLTSKMKVLGGTDSTTGNPIDIREVNPTGTNYLVNFSYFMDNGLASQSLINAWNAYTAKYNSTVTNYITALNTYKTKVAELTTLNSQLTDLQSNQTAQSTIMGTLVQSNNNKVPNSSDTGYTLYQEALGLYNSYTSQIYLKKVEIITKESEITTAKNALSAISSTIDWSSNFTQVQLSELNNFIFQNEDYEDSTFVIGESTSSEEAIEIKLELMQNAANELAKISHPQYTFTTTMSNLFSIRDDKDSIISYSEWRNKFQIGNLITIKFTDTYYLTVRLIQISINFNNIEEIECTFSNKSRLDDELTQLAETIANSGKAANSYSLSKFGYDSASSINSEVRDFMNSMLTATKNAMASNDNQELLIDTYGLHMKKWLPDQNIYSPYQAWWTNNTLLFTDDSWNSSKGGIGVFTDSSGNKTMSVFADVICGQLLMSEKLYISNNSGTYTINNHGFIATATVGSNTYSAGINPSVPSEIINVKVNGVNKLYVDTVNNRLAIDGALVAGSININNRFTVDSTGACTATALTLTGGAINIGNRFIVTTAGIVTINSNSLIVNSSNFTLTEDGTLTCNNLTATNGNFSGSITSTSGTIGGWIIGSNSFTSNGNSTININNGSNKSMIIDYNGLTLYNKNTANAHYGDVTAVWDGYSAGGIMLSQGLNATHIAIGYNTSSNTYNTAMLFTSNGFSSPVYGTVAAGFSFYRAVNISSTLKVNNNTVIHQGNYNSLGLTYPTNGSTHTHDTLDDNGYELNWAGSSCLFAWSGQDLGQSSYRWGGLYLSSAPNVSSDRNLKHDIETLPDIYKTIILKLRPVRFKYNDGSSDRFHTGFISQELEEVMDSLGVDSKDFAAFIKAPTYSVIDDNGMYDTSSEITGYIYMLRHEELISPIVDLLQEQKNKIDDLENRLNIVESKLQL